MIHGLFVQMSLKSQRLLSENSSRDVWRPDNVEKINDISLDDYQEYSVNKSIRDLREFGGYCWYEELEKQ